MNGREGVLACRGRAARFVVRDMGNGVDKVELSEVIPLECAQADAALCGREPIIATDRLRDLCGVAIGSPGVWCEDCPIQGFVRALADNTFEAVSWRPAA